MLIEDLFVSFELFFSFQNIFAIFIGVVIGTITGAIPGMTTVMGVALALPFTFSLPPVTGILLLLGIYKGGLYGGSITAILLKAPGTPAASCTVLDGFPMAQRGEGQRALDIALYSSCVADFISNISLILLTGFLATYALRFGPPEFATLIIFSLTIIAGVSGDDLARGIFAACAGLILATVGLDIIYGTDRFIFGEYELLAGVNFIPVLIGLFALPEIINYYTKKADGRDKVKQLGQKGASFADFRKCLKSIIRGSVIGVILGVIPGIGGAPSAFLSYSEAKRTSKNKDNFGKGEIEGVAAAEAGNNGVAGSTMIPLIALGVPGDVVTAIILGAFMIHGLQPGPVMFSQNLTIVYAIFIGILFSSFFLFLVGKGSIRTISKLSNISNDILYPVVLVLCIFGAYAINNNTFDILVMALMSIFGFLLLRLKIPAAPFLIAFILGPLLEDSFRQSLLLSRGDYQIFFRSYICIVFWALTALSFTFLILGQFRVNPKIKNLKT
ncbi:MAG: tripartite tricarboxylate transporter permease [Parvularculales bacterium]